MTFTKRLILLSAGAVATALAITCPLAVFSQTTQQSFPSDSDANGIRTQKVERLALQILETAQVKEAIEKGIATYAASAIASKPDAMRYARSAVEEAATFAALNAAMGGVSDPTFVWLYAAPRRWHGYSLPGSRWYADNVDTFYRAVRVDETSSYEITVLPGKVLPSQLSFMLYNWLIHDGTDPRNDVPLGTLTITEATPRNPDGSITLTVGPELANGRPTHLQLKPGAKQVLVREIRGDETLPAVRLSVRRTRGNPPPKKTINDLAAETAAYIAAGTFGSTNISVGFGKMAENQLGAPRVRWLEEGNQKLTTDEPVGPDQALGFLSPFVFNIKEDEALIVTLNMMGAEYLSVSSYRPFLVSPEHVFGTSSLNNYQSKKNPDGSITFVFARKDPGVYNWIDVGGIPYGSVGVRWQTLTKPVAPTLQNAVQTAKVVKLADLRKELPATTAWVSAQERREQRANRARNFLLRCLGDPCEVGGELDKPH
ncbi:hypothetical protein [Candidatus Phycosocius spiralis]|uniref:DUF1214 domain-containing protein n=1 Tax=Candidatus Phycosocius spiralis TaxID=2815099 RepID=A0ABQ4PSL0_9PROT|nr:hypothetical protein [Candidatus Phycosocius spiralis]GIU65945.1 hypothetical protein PsB1_0099 [Candidatus Phycosocius spiralis]